MSDKKYIRKNLYTKMVFQDAKGNTDLIKYFKTRSDNQSTNMPKITPKNVNVVNKKGKNALMYAITNLYVNILPFLITDVSIKQQDNNGWSPLMYAIYFNRSCEIIKLLIRPETVNLVSNDGNALYILLKQLKYYNNANKLRTYNIFKLLATPENVNYIRKGKSMLYKLLSKLHSTYDLQKINDVGINVLKLFITEQTLAHKYCDQTIFQYIRGMYYPKSDVTNLDTCKYKPIPDEIFDLLKTHSKIYTIIISNADGTVISTQKVDLS